MTNETNQDPLYRNLNEIYQEREKLFQQREQDYLKQKNALNKLLESMKQEKETLNQKEQELKQQQESLHKDEQNQQIRYQQLCEERKQLEHDKAELNKKEQEFEAAKDSMEVRYQVQIEKAKNMEIQAKQTKESFEHKLDMLGLILDADGKPGGETGEGPMPLPEPDEFEMENVALNKSTSQSSTVYGAGSERAVDGNTNGDYGQGSVTHTDEEKNAWWMVDLGGLYEINDIQVYNRTDFCSNRLSDFNIQILDSKEQIVWSNHQTSMPDPMVKVEADWTLGRYVKIELNNTNNLSLAEVIVHGKLKNLALGKGTSQSSTEYGGNSERAVDGNISGEFSQNSVTHTSYQEQPWWQVDLGTMYDITNIHIYNRTDACSERLSNYTIYLLDEDGNEVWSNHQIDMPNPNVSISVTGKGRYIKIQLDGENYLSLAEVQVYGK